MCVSNQSPTFTADVGAGYNPAHHTVFEKSDECEPLNASEAPMLARLAGWIPTLLTPEIQHCLYLTMDAFLAQIETPKDTPRRGWVLRRVPSPESVADHMYRMIMICLAHPSLGESGRGPTNYLRAPSSTACVPKGVIAPAVESKERDRGRRRLLPSPRCSRGHRRGTFLPPTASPEVVRALPHHQFCRSWSEDRKHLRESLGLRFLVCLAKQGGEDDLISCELNRRHRDQSSRDL